MDRKFALAVIACLPILGCGSLGPKTASLNHVSHRDLIRSDFKREMWIPLADKRSGSINIFSIDEANAPRKYLNIYCNRDGGRLEHVSLDSDVYSNHEDVKELTGTFACKSQSGKTLWAAEVDARRSVGGLQRGGTFGYLLSVRAKDV